MPKKIHKEVLTEEQKKLLPVLKDFSKNFGLVGGTAIALHLGHRRSIDFDLFSNEKFGNKELLNKIWKRQKIDNIIVNKLDELTVIIEGVKFTFFRYPFEIKYDHVFEDVIKYPDLLTLAAMKAFALGMRAKWKDYVDLYFVIKYHFSVDEISQQAQFIFKENFNKKLFRVQLGYYEGINYNEEVEFLPGCEIDEEKIKKELINFSLE